MSHPSVRGIIHFIDDTKTYGQNGFRKRVVVLEQQKEKFTNYIPLEFTHDGCDSVDDLSIGDDVEVSYRLSGRKWQKDASSEVRYFLNAEAMGFQIVSSQGTDQVGAPDSAVNDALAEVNDDDIPF